PGTAAFAFAGVGVEVEATAQYVVGVADVVDGNVPVPHGQAFDRPDVQTVQTLDDAEQAVDDRGRREIGAQVFVRQAVTALLELFAVIGNIPGFQRIDAVFACQSAQVIQLLFCRGPRAPGQI